MFIIDQTIEDFKVRERNIFKVFFSMNNHQVATPEMMLEDARSYILFLREAQHKISAYIGLHLLLTDRKLYYAHSSNPFPESDLDAVQEEALNFAEGLGAMLDVLDFTRLSPEDANNWIDKQDIFKCIPATKSTPGAMTPVEEQPELPAGQQALSGSAPVPEQAMLSQHPLEPPKQSATVTPNARPLQSQEAQLPPVVPQAAMLPQPQTQQVPPVQPAPQQALPVIPQVQDPRHAQTASSVLQDRGLSNEESTSVQPREKAPVEQKREDPRLPQKTPDTHLQETRAKQLSRSTGATTPQSAAYKGRQEIFEQAIKSGFVKVPKPSGRKASRSASGLVSRDREALARLLTSF